MSGSKPAEPRSNDLVGARDAKKEADKQIAEIDKTFEPEKPEKPTSTATDTGTNTGT